MGKQIIVYKNPHFRVLRETINKPDGQTGEYFIIDSPPAVFIVPLTDQREIYLVKLYRHTTKVHSIEVPAGGAESLSLFDDAKRELQEETGLLANDWKELGTLQSFNGSSSHLSTVFLASGVTQSTEHKEEEEGITQLTKVKFSQALEMIKDGSITDSGSISAIMLAYLHFKK